MDKNNPNYGYEFLNHPADVWVHAWGKSFEEGIENCVYALMETMFEGNIIDNKITREIITHLENWKSMQYVREKFLILQSTLLILKLRRLLILIWKLMKKKNEPILKLYMIFDMIFF